MTESQPSLPQRRPRGSASRWMQRLERAQWVQSAIVAIATWYIRFVQATSRVVYEPGNPFEMYRDALPGIGTLWHGYQFMLSPLRPPDIPVRIMISNHRDGEITARVAERFGAETIRGSGGRSGRWLRKGGVSSFLAAASSLAEGYTVILTADISRGPARRAGLGIITLARNSGKAIVGVGLAASRRIVFNSWDRTVLPLPFGRIAVVAAPVVWVPSDASDAVMEEKRRELEDGLNAATERALQLVARRR